MFQERLRFKIRKKAIRRKRNKFFAPAIRNIGKTKEELRKEKSEKVAKKRIIQIGGGFEAPQPDTVRRKRTLFRSASSLGLKQYELNNSFLFDEFLKELENIKVKNANNIKQEEVEEHVNDESLDMVQILTKTRKKIVLLKNKQYHFSSNNDVLQLRGKTKFETNIMPEAILNEENKDDRQKQTDSKNTKKAKKP